MDLVLAGGGHSVRECRQVLLRAGYEIGSDLAEDGSCPVILGDVPRLFLRCRQVIESGRHLLIAAPCALSSEQLASLFAARRPRQALYLWSERRHHPGYRLLSGLVRSGDGGWRPRQIRQLNLSAARPTAAAIRWLACEALSVVIELCEGRPRRVSAFGALNRTQGSLDFICTVVSLDNALAFVHVGLGEGIERRETELASSERRAYVDELNPSTPIRLVDDRDAPAGGPRRISFSPPGQTHLAKQQCLAFLEGTTSTARSQAEADLWLGAIGAWQAAETSLATQGARTEVREPAASIRVINGLAAFEERPSPQLLVVG